MCGVNNFEAKKTIDQALLDAVKIQCMFWEVELLASTSKAKLCIRNL
ncbi:hypothetical protein SynPROSU1_02524 [Synechococcus sp. PROS-U-1]|nr:hypothetical protein SynPROSU1_02524 [Synechococcus sp. PROS-U-1]